MDQNQAQEATKAAAQAKAKPKHGEQTTGPDGLIIEKVNEPALGQNVTVRELFLKDTGDVITKAANDGKNRGMALLSVAMEVDGKRITLDEIDRMPSRKFGAVMRAVQVALRLNGLADDVDEDGNPPATAAEAAKNG